MQLAKCKMQNEIAVSNRSSLTCSYLQTTSLHFVPRFVNPSKSKILFEYMSKIWQSPKCLANAVPKPASVQLIHEANLGVESIKAYLSVCKTDWTTNNVPILMKTTLHSVSAHCQKPVRKLQAWRASLLRRMSNMKFSRAAKGNCLGFCHFWLHMYIQCCRCTRSSICNPT